MQQIFCNNCGEKGHAFRECVMPVLSCGIILVRNRVAPNQPTVLPLDINNIELLMIRRKDSMAYTDFMRGKYVCTDIVYVMRLLENMTQTELKNLRTQTFETLWARMWNFSDRHEHEMLQAKEKFQMVHHLINNARSPYSEPEWGFPKGRRFRSETDAQCAVREFTEETNIPRTAYVILQGIVFSETFHGTNNISYEHRYNLAALVHPEQFDLHQKFSTLQRREISAIGWKTMADCASLTRPHYVGRDSLLQELAKIVTVISIGIPFREDDNGNPSSTKSA
jgi:8-oxo-dGTP pyrophosphatase MutT (NUDIX family)